MTMTEVVTAMRTDGVADEDDDFALGRDTTALCPVVWPLRVLRM